MVTFFPYQSAASDRLTIIKEVILGKRTQVSAGFALGISERQVRRIVAKVRQNGDLGVVHGGVGRQSCNKFSDELIAQISELLREKYSDFGSTFASEKLLELHNIKASKETVRKLQIKLRLRKSKRKREKKLHQLRERRPRFGELIQIDGSPHRWFEERGEPCCLLVFIDDATSKLTSLLFFPTETTAGYLQALQVHILKYGVPICLYSDKHGIFRVNAKEPVSGDGRTEFAKCLERVGVKIIHASTPQAKGRVECANRTLQDRLVKEMRLRNINNIEDANAFLPEFIEKYNQRFACEPLEKEDAHRQLTMNNQELELALSVQETRILSKNLTFSYQGTTYLVKLKHGQFGTSMRGGKITIYNARNKELRASYKGRVIEFTAFRNQPKIADVVDDKCINYQVNQMIKSLAA